MGIPAVERGPGGPPAPGTAAIDLTTTQVPIRQTPTSRSASRWSARPPATRPATPSPTWATSPAAASTASSSPPPSLTATPTGSTRHRPATSAAYLVFGSKAVNITTVSDFLKLTRAPDPRRRPLTSGQRAGDLGTSSAAQSGQPDGRRPDRPDRSCSRPPAPPRPSASTSTASTLRHRAGTATRASASRSRPWATSTATGSTTSPSAPPTTPAAAEAFVIYGGTGLATLSRGHQDDRPRAHPRDHQRRGPHQGRQLQPARRGAPATNRSATRSRGIGNYFNYQPHGRGPRPSASRACNDNTGAAFAISGDLRQLASPPAPTSTSPPSGPTNSLDGIEYTGVNAGDLVGASIASAGSFDGASTSSQPGPASTDLLIGAPGQRRGGAAYLVYGIQTTDRQLHPRDHPVSLSTLGVAPTTNAP